MKLYTYTQNGKVYAIARFRKTDARIYCDLKVDGLPSLHAPQAAGVMTGTVWPLISA
jgi:hypothetical protein